MTATATTTAPAPVPSLTVTTEVPLSRIADLLGPVTTDEAALAECDALDAAYAAADDEARRNSHPEVRVDLKWSLWSTDEGTWLDYAPDVWPLLRTALTELPEGCSLTIRTSPRKEVCSGTVVIHHADGDLVADVSFAAEWDDPFDLADTLLTRRLRTLSTHPRRGRQEGLRRLRCQRTEATDTEREALAQALTQAPRAAIANERVVLPDTLDGSLALIDAVEDTLALSDDASWGQLEASVDRGDYDHLLDPDVRPRKTRSPS